MTVSELIVELQKLPQDMKVVSIKDTYSGDVYGDVESVEIIGLKGNGLYVSVFPGSTVEKPDFQAVILE